MDKINDSLNQVGFEDGFVSMEYLREHPEVFSDINFRGLRFATESKKEKEIKKEIASGKTTIAQLINKMAERVNVVSFKEAKINKVQFLMNFNYWRPKGTDTYYLDTAETIERLDRNKIDLFPALFKGTKAGINNCYFEVKKKGSKTIYIYRRVEL